jgi:3-phenylpropionate/cinnamic acid dioxygenase small subunit
LKGKVQKLEERVAKIEEQKAQKALEDTEREEQLRNCVQIDAEEAYWSVIRLNGTKTATGYRFPSHIGDRALREKQMKIEECKLLYGR